MKKETKTIAVIPARYASTRFPGKPLAPILGKPMLQYVYERACQAKLVNRVVIATDDGRIASAAKQFRAEVVMTSAYCATGTDRVAAVLEGGGYDDYDLVVNIQGDEPLLDPALVDSCIRVMLMDENLAMSTAKCSIEESKELFDPNVVKVVTDQRGLALYFSRSTIPYHRDKWGSISPPQETSGKAVEVENAYKHIGLYVYKRDFLLKFTKLAPTPLENLERLEQLRALEHGFSIGVIETKNKSYGVDTLEDLTLVEKILMDAKSLVL